MKDSKRSERLSRRDAMAIVGGGAALGVNAALASIVGGTAGVALLCDGARAGQAAIGPAPTLAKLTAEHFESLAGQPFTIGGQRVMLRAVRRGPATPARFRDQFAVTFTAPPGLSTGPEPVTVAHPAIGRHDLVAIEVGDSSGRTLEICFG